MSELLIIEPIDLSYQGAAPSLTAISGAAGANLISNDPREIWVNNGLNVVGDPTTFLIDLGKDVEFDSIYLGNTNANSDASWAVTFGPESSNSYFEFVAFTGEAMALPFDDAVQQRSASLYIFPNVVTARFVAVNVSQYSGDPLQIGRLIIGKAFKPFYNKERGAQRVPLDSGTRTRLSDGSLSTVSGVLISGFKWVFGDLSEVEANKVWGIILRRRTTEPVIVIEDADNLSAESVHYCTLIDLQPYTRLDPRKTRWELSAEDWL